MNAGGLEPPVPTRIYLFKDGWTFNKFRPDRSFLVGYMAPTLGGNYVAINAQVPRAEPMEIVYHEYTHFLHWNSASFHIPPWYSEGLAEFLSTLRVRDGRIEIGRPPRSNLERLRGSDRHRRRLFPGDFLSLAQIMTMREIRWTPDVFSMFYAKSWLLTHYLYAGHLSGFERRREQLDRYLTLLDEGRSPEQACEEAFGVDFGELEHEMLRYLKRGTLPLITFPVNEFEVGERASVRPLPPHESMYKLGDLLLQLGPERAEGAEHLFERAMADDPSHPLPYQGLARARAAQGLGGAEDLFERALSLAPQHAGIHLSYADYLQVQLEARQHSLTEGERRQLLDQARSHYLVSIELEPGMPASHAGLGALYRFQDDGFAAGIQHLETARSMMRWSTTTSLYLGELYLKAGHPERGRETLEEVLRWSHGGGEAARARQLLDQLDGGPEVGEAAGRDTDL
jgi:tetratricopeptide (TPR) repeat protein